MADVFLSYSSQDRVLAGKVAALLTGRGLSIWYDAELGTGAAYRAVIQSAMDSAGIVLVLWTADASASAWVKDEADTGRKRGILYSVACGASTVPADFRRSVFSRIRHPEEGPTASELSSLAHGLLDMLATVRSVDRLSTGSVIARLTDFLSTSAVFALLIAPVLLSMPRKPNALDIHDPLSIGITAGVVGLVLSGMSFGSARLFEHLALKYLATNAGPSLGRLFYRWVGEATGCAVPIMIAVAASGTTYFAHPRIQFAGRFILGLSLLWAVLMVALGLKYLVFMACPRCRYFLLMR
jgi:hypothetical protein